MAQHHPDIAFIGAGRLARGLALALARAGCEITAVGSRSAASAQGLARLMAAEGRPAPAVLSPQAAADVAELVFLTVPDDAIARVAGEIRWRAGQLVAHCSGATEIEALMPAAAAGAHIGGFHPLQAFTHPEAAATTLAGCSIGIEAGEPLFGTLASLARTIGCHALRLPPGSRARYHAAAGHASQHINVLLREASAIWQSIGIAEDDAVRALLPLSKGILASIEAQGLAKGLPGPVSRGDVGTVRRHVESLGELGSDALDLYCELALRSVTLALERGSIDAAKAEELRQILGKI